VSTSSQTDRRPVKQGLAGGTTFAAAILLFTGSLLAVLQGISAIADDDIFVVAPNYTYEFDITAWGWIHLIAGIIGLAIAVGLITGALWARAGAVTIAAISIVINFLWLPHYPLWSILVIALDLIVIWAVTTWRTDTVDR
jgi:hypothetical protein